NGPRRRQGTAGCARAMQCIRDRRLEAAETEIETVFVIERFGKCVGSWIARSCLAFDRRATRKPQPKQAGNLVEGLACRVVNRSAKQTKIQCALAVKQARVATADYQSHTRKN